MVRFFRFNLSS